MNDDSEELDDTANGKKESNMKTKETKDQVKHEETKKQQIKQKVSKETDENEEVDMVDEYEKFLARKQDNEEMVQEIEQTQIYEEKQIQPFLKDKYDYNMNKDKLR